jgi:hypothetical protein
MRKESVKDRLEQAYLYHYCSNMVLCGSLPRQGDTTLWYDYSPKRNTGTLSGGIVWVRLSSGMWVLDHDGTDGIVTIGATAGNIKSFAAWVYVDTKNKSIADFDSGTHSVETENTPKLQATGWDSPTYYVNGVATDAIATGAWKHIAVTTSTQFAATDIILGKEASVYNGKMALVLVSASALSAEFVKTYFNNTRHLFGV